MPVFTHDDYRPHVNEDEPVHRDEHFGGRYDRYKGNTESNTTLGCPKDIGVDSINEDERVAYGTSMYVSYVAGLEGTYPLERGYSQRPKIIPR